jgi:hypothetical protein
VPARPFADTTVMAAAGRYASRTKGTAHIEIPSPGKCKPTQLSDVYLTPPPTVEQQDIGTRLRSRDCFPPRRQCPDPLSAMWAR